MMQVLARRPVTAAGVGAVAGPLFVVLATHASVVAGAGVMVAMLGGIAVLIQPWLGFLLTAAVVPLERIGRISGDASAVGFSLMRVVGMGTLACFLLHQLARRGRLRVPLPLVLYSVYAGIGALTLSYTSDWEYGIRTMGAIIGNALFFFLVINIVRSTTQARIAIAIWLATTMGI